MTIDPIDDFILFHTKDRNKKHILNNKTKKKNINKTKFILLRMHLRSILTSKLLNDNLLLNALLINYNMVTTKIFYSMHTEFSAFVIIEERKSKYKQTVWSLFVRQN